MKSRVLKTVLSAACALAPLAAVPAGPAVAQTIVGPSGDIALSIGRGQLVTVPGNMADIFVSNEAVADVQVKSQRQLYVFGKAGGETTVYASNSAGDIIWSANIRVGNNIDSIDQMLALAMPEAKIQVATMGINTVLLTGTVAAPEDAAEAERLVAAFVGQGANVVTRLRMATPLQVNLRVRFAEVSRSLVRTLGSNLVTQDNTDGFSFMLQQGRGDNAIHFPTQEELASNPNAQTIFTQLAGTTQIGGIFKFLGMDIGQAFDMAERDGLITILAEPNLTALSGETAEFLAGGEFPIPLSQGLGTTTIEYKNFGVSLSYTPTVLANGRISIRVRPEVSELSTQGAVTVGSFSIPALTVRRAETTVELGSGQSFMIAGLLKNDAQTATNKLPGAGDVPILGSLFRSTEFRKGQTELVIVVTPYLVRPVNHDSDIALPTDGYRTPTAIDQFLGNMDNAGVTGGTRPMPEAESEGTAPEIGLIDQGGPDLAADNRRQPGEGAQTAAAAAPGFSNIR